MALTELGPTFIKFGQLLSTRPDLVGEEAAHNLLSLQDNLPPVSFDQIKAAIEASFDQPIEAAASVDRVDSKVKAPVCWMTEFGDSSLNFKLRFWIDDPQQGLTNIRGKVLLALWDIFKEHGIGIPFPQQDVHLYKAD